MSRHIRNFLFFLLGFATVACPLLSFAETIQASGGEPQGVRKGYNGYGEWYATLAGACDDQLATYTPSGYPYNTWTIASSSDNGTNGICNVVGTNANIIGNKIEVSYSYSCGPSGSPAVTTNCPKVYSCPTGQNWTLSGSTCTRPECVAPQIRLPDGTCEAPKCKLGPNDKVGSGRYEIPYPQPSGVRWCVENCQVYAAGDRNTVGNITYTEMFVNGAGYDASTCVAADVPPVPKENPQVQNEAPCNSQTQGAITIGGKVKCVDKSVPGATAPPLVTKSQSTDTKSDGSKVITETTNTCTGDGACTSTTTTTVTNNSAGQPGLAGTPGTSTKTTDKPSSEQSSFCSQNPNLQMCKGGMNEEATQKKVVEELQKLTKPDDSSVATMESIANFSAASSQDLMDADQKINEYSNGIKSDPILNEKKSVWETTMSNGWFEPVVISTCQPYEATIGGRQWRLDPCPTAQKISDIGAYCLWFMLAVGSFVFLTGGRS